MASTPAVPLAERADIHKSCKALETLLNIFNDYCEAAGAVVALQKKLSKGLKETASLKVTGEIAANALNASANIFESLSDIDSKYAKLVDKEYDGISSEVKKWFKKLAKEEKAHDERMVGANARIKQAGQIYEKKSKKNARDASDEHARYINLISSLGPEISQEKYNHSLLVTQRHTATTFSVAACLARVADAEWLRTCEGVRRFAPTIGPLGEYRALCEGGWTGPMPADLPDVDLTTEADTDASHKPSDTLSPETYRNLESVTRETVAEPQPPAGPSPPSYQREQEPTPPPVNTPEQNYSISTAPSSYDRPKPLVDPNTGSVRSLSAFPSPPTHFPPPLRQQVSQGQSSRSPSQASFPTTPRPYDSRKLDDADDGGASSHNVSTNSSPETKFNEPKQLDSLAEDDDDRPIPSRAQTIDSFSNQESSTGSGSSARKGDYFTDESDYKPRRTVERTDTGASSGSIVAAMRSRYSNNSGASSPPPRDLPRLPLSVNNLASRYDEPASPRARPSSPPMPRPRPSLDSYLQNSPSTPDEETSRRRRQQLVDQMTNLELQEKEQQLRARERDIEMRTRELEMEKSNLLNARSNLAEGYGDGASRSGILRPRERHLSLQHQQRPVSQNELAAPSLASPKRSTSPYSSHLQPPSGSRQGGSDETSEYDRTSVKSAEHPDYCGCEACTKSKYNSPSPTPRSPISPRPVTNEKPKGWMRRLSMPIVVGNAFLDGKKVNGKGHLASLDSKKNASSTMLKSSVSEEGRITSNAAGIGAGGGRRSYDASGLGNRSVTNLGLGRR